MQYDIVDAHHIPLDILDTVRRRLQPNARRSRQLPVIVVRGNHRPIVDTVAGRVCCVIGKDWLCGDYYDRTPTPPLSYLEIAQKLCSGQTTPVIMRAADVAALGRIVQHLDHSRHQ
jgi:hypothetical protein